MKYAYTQNNLVDTRFHYMYTPFEGKDFLLAYNHQRLHIIKKLSTNRKTFQEQQRVDTHLPEEIRALATNGAAKTDILKSHQTTVITYLPGQIDFETYPLLLDLLHTLFYSNAPSTNFKNWIDYLLKRFEVSKRLYKAYHANGKPKVKRYKNLREYVLFNLLLACIYQRTQNLKYLNTILKLSDTICSANILQVGPLSQIVALTAIELEHGFIETLIKKHKITQWEF